ncbi:hypothetical protein M0R89_09925 [Halorussus limi]|uniref:Uncharacterized protein n=1 Tax=Halorussus limi TaxID=2938695 RepID=A0A8U0HPR9_9EURY|nr:hypothetical protein [Halorussus limi]UPV72867.1 hypothetical protein M0R89_09925 [Halorussus limi]
MPEFTLQSSRADARVPAEATFERTEEVEIRCETGSRIAGKTGGGRVGDGGSVTAAFATPVPVATP